MKAFLIAFSSTLALAASVVSPRQANALVPEFVSIDRQPGFRGDGDGCPENTFGHSFNAGANPDTVSIQFGTNYVSLDPNDPSAVRERKCIYEIKMRFPLGCSSATFQSFPSGYARVEDGAEAKINSQYVMSPTTSQTHWTQPQEIVLDSDEWGVDAPNPYFGQDRGIFQQDFTFRQNITNENERVITFTSTFEFFLAASSPKEVSLFMVDALELKVAGFATC